LNVSFFIFRTIFEKTTLNNLSVIAYLLRLGLGRTAV
jgi:hypothetical protein